MKEFYTYAFITQHCYMQMCQLMAESERQAGEEARYREERAYGVYIGWRALVIEHTAPDVFYSDDRRLEAVLKSNKSKKIRTEPSA